MSKLWISKIEVLSLLAVTFVATSVFAESQYNIIVGSRKTAYTVVIDYTRGGKLLTNSLVGPGSKTFSVKADSIEKVTYEKTGTNGTMRVIIKQGTGKDEISLYDSGSFDKNVKVELTKKDLNSKTTP